MPELPEVQTIVNDLNKKIVGRKITAVWFDVPKIIKRPLPQEFERQIKGLKIIKVERLGKNILIYLKGDYLLVVHQKMTGHLLVGEWRIKKAGNSSADIKNQKVESLLKGPHQERINNYIHLIFFFDDGKQLALSDLRKFAKVLFGKRNEIEKSPDLMKIAPDPFDKKLKEENFIDLISRQRRKIKLVLMDQSVISGIGNIYSDEALFLSRINPFMPANKIGRKKLKILYTAIRSILRKAIKLRGTSISDFRDTDGRAGFYGEKRLIYQRAGELCFRCQTPIKRAKLGARSTHFCPRCQRIE